MSRLFATLLMMMLSTNACLASEGEDQANAFAKIYLSLCMKHLVNLDALREKLRPLPSLPPEKATLFLSGSPGNAWPVPDKYGTFVLTIPNGKDICLVHARRADTETTIKLFTEMVAHAPAPLTSTLVQNERAQTPANGQIQTLAYAWSVPGATRKMLFTLTTAESEFAQLQVLGSAALISQ